MGLVSSIAVAIANTIRRGTPKAMIHSVFRTDVQKNGSPWFLAPFRVSLPNMNR